MCMRPMNPRPMMPTRVMSVPDDPANEGVGRPQIPDSSFAGFPLECQGALKIWSERREERGPVHLARAHDHFLTPGPRHLGPRGVFDMTLLDVGPQRPESRDRIAL